MYPMPTTYAHDLFGQKAYAFLNPEIKQVIRKTKSFSNWPARTGYSFL